MPSYILKAIATGHACCFDAPNDAEARARAQTELRQIATALYPPSSNGTYAIRRRITGSLTLDYTSRTTMDDMLGIVRGFDFDVEDFGETDDGGVEGYVEFLYEPVEDIGRMERLRAALPEHAGLHLLQDGNAKARISCALEGHEYDPPDDAHETLLEVLLSDKVPLCTEPSVRGDGECDGEGHDLWAPVSLVGGLDVNPGVFGLGGDRLLTQKVCLNCACTIETTHNGCRAHDEGKPECEIRVLPPSEFTQAWAEAKRNEFRRMQPVPFTVGDLERVLDLIDIVRAGNTDVMHLEDEAQAVWNWLLSYMPSPPPSADDGKI